MMHDKPECDSCCAGTAPYFMCRDKECFCHMEKHLKAINTPLSLGYNDPTPRKVLRKLGTRR